MAWPASPKNRPSPAEAQERLNKIMSDPNSAYLNLKGTSTPAARDEAIKMADQLREVIAGKRDWLT